MSNISFSPRKSGFTIVELLIVIVVIGILAAISIVAYSGIQERAKVAKANTDLATLVKSIQIARLSVGKTLMGVTGSGCTRCAGTQAAYDLALDNISLAAGTNLSFLKVGDPWGDRYVLDENEGEQVATPCVRDSLTLGAVHSGVQAAVVPFYNCPN
ncbi:prepilin-type N-terminal cleavage/methylation domain-containing protein [Candidatus Saccharibacteria bacterium]|nr:prepilin-type N-terminal cleavage/methylation domain-containing protein [Candidatus Saccharibacteria bacterium]